MVALAWMADHDERCSGCSLPLSQTTDPEAFEDYDTTSVVCHACADRDRTRARLQRDNVTADGLFLYVTKREDLTVGN